MCDPTATHAVLADDDRVDAFFLDPFTDVPVLRTPPDRGKPTWRFYAPLAFPADGAELASAVLHHTVWTPPVTGTAPRDLHADRTPVVGQRLGRPAQ
ncbi:hypothetical protein [Streptomyces rimosus]|uniref:hypothetical protein n=1 Tax=Streptomyces rimosus TaxID=1927 RepID=UPI00131D4F37|nr:hypothetical protein [Streptomyces rimosus]